ncbi:uncharacterized protein LOC101027244 precursor [Zea mays]|uniref:Uncharacterized protein n=1 Tax=Zea mays TaxID=4577 RepID=A0A804Q1W3_MAIZE|nr:uncharacterized protein LOC101027244 precursor [Zea mays]
MESLFHRLPVFVLLICVTCVSPGEGGRARDRDGGDGGCRGGRGGGGCCCGFDAAAVWEETAPRDWEWAHSTRLVSLSAAAGDPAPCGIGPSQQAGSRPGTDGRRRRMEAAATSQPHRRPRMQEKEAVFAWTGIADLTAD